MVGEAVVLEGKTFGEDAELCVVGVEQRGGDGGGQRDVHRVLEWKLVDGVDEAEEPDGGSTDPELGHLTAGGAGNG